MSGEWSFVYRVNRPNTWRQRIGHALIAIARRLDKSRYYTATEIITTPTLPDELIEKCIIMGQDKTIELIAESARAEAVEEVMREFAPTLYNEESQKV